MKNFLLTLSLFLLFSGCSQNEDSIENDQDTSPKITWSKRDPLPDLINLYSCNENIENEDELAEFIVQHLSGLCDNKKTDSTRTELSNPQVIYQGRLPVCSDFATRHTNIGGPGDLLSHWGFSMKDLKYTSLLGKSDKHLNGTEISCE